MNEARNKRRLPSALVLALPSEKIAQAASVCAAWQNVLNVRCARNCATAGSLIALAASRQPAHRRVCTGQESTLNRTIGKPVVFILAAILLVHLTFTAIDHARMKSERERRVAAMTATFRGVFPMRKRWSMRPCRCSAS